MAGNDWASHASTISRQEVDAEPGCRCKKERACSEPKRSGLEMDQRGSPRGKGCKTSREADGTVAHLSRSLELELGARSLQLTAQCSSLFPMRAHLLLDLPGLSMLYLNASLSKRLCHAPNFPSCILTGEPKSEICVDADLDLDVGTQQI